MAAEVLELAGLVAAARAWRDALIPGTCTATIPAVRSLQRAVAQYDCTHPRAMWVFDPVHADVECTRCALRFPPPEESSCIPDA